jgi:hypothetical protein
VAHSLGGLISRYYAQVLGGRMDALVAMGTPHRGTRRAEGWPLGLARELTPGSPTLRTLEATRSKIGHARLTSIVGLQDLLVTPESAALAGSRVVRVDGVGHHGLLYHPEAWDATIEEITHAARKAEHERVQREIAARKAALITQGITPESRSERKRRLAREATERAARRSQVPKAVSDHRVAQTVAGPSFDRNINRRRSGQVHAASRIQEETQECATARHWE